MLYISPLKILKLCINIEVKKKNVMAISSFYYIESITLGVGEEIHEVLEKANSINSDMIS